MEFIFLAKGNKFQENEKKSFHENGNCYMF